ncbi:MAG: efflux RND transporter periplasmic adaptor subunit, partial [Thermodesulfobacteriota bacterium]|nr:efflux RND transporter periplasmic adaptor subunit [Thermodesulfobacteriota bacterium]
MGEKYRKIVTTGIVIALAIGEAVFLSGCSEKIHESRAVQEKEVNLQSEISYWTCGMHPTVRSDKAGICPICSLDLIPVEAKKGASSETQGKLGLFLNERSRDLARIKTTPVQWRKLEKEIYTVGKVAYDESTVAIVSAWAGGRIDRLYADYTGVQVRRGDHLVLMYSPQLVAAQDEYLVAYKSGNQSFI